MSAVYLYVPPMKKYPIQFGKSALLVNLTMSTTVYRMDSVWYNAESPVVDYNDIDVDEDTGLLLWFPQPMVVPESLYAGLNALSPADSSWTEGTLTQL